MYVCNLKFKSFVNYYFLHLLIIKNTYRYIVIQVHTCLLKSNNNRQYDTKKKIKINKLSKKKIIYIIIRMLFLT